MERQGTAAEVAAAVGRQQQLTAELTACQVSAEHERLRREAAEESLQLHAEVPHLACSSSCVMYEQTSMVQQGH